MKIFFCLLILFVSVGVQAQSSMYTTAFWKKNAPPADPCPGGAGSACAGGGISAGTLGTDKYMVTPGRCGDIPAGQISGGSGGTFTSYSLTDFTPTCAGGTDTLTKTWKDDQASNYYDHPGLVNYSATTGTGNGAINTDANYGSTNTANIVLVTALAQGGYHAAARYCDKLSYGGYTDWYLPNRYELNLLYVNRITIGGFASAMYWSSSETHNISAWLQDFSTGNQTYANKYSARLIRCVRKY